MENGGGRGSKSVEDSRGSVFSTSFAAYPTV